MSSLVPTPTILFVCTGNVYRSRFAEGLFNHLATTSSLPVQAQSRRLAPQATLEDSISPWVVGVLRSMGISLSHTSPIKRMLGLNDLERAKLTIALSEEEHRPLFAKLFPEWVSRIEYWQVRDIPDWEPERTLAHIDAQVRTLVQRLTSPDQRAETPACLDSLARC